jgi:mannose-1-phosphate guanylyltransferase/phosphomannomutase
MLPVNNRSAFERILDLLADNGFSGAAVTTMYLPEQLESVTHSRIDLAFFRENEPRGSAGAVRALSGFLADTVLIISGDAVCDFELKKYYEKHIAENRQATMLLTKTKNPKEFGTVLLDGKSGKIERFLEKPSWADTLSNLINTGIYILDKSIIDMIPEGIFFDFGRDLFPLLLKKNIPVYGETAHGSWCDIGTFGDYYGCSMKLSDEKNIIGAGCRIDKDAKISGSILFENVKVGASEITDSIIGENVVVGNGCMIPEGCVIGGGSVIGDRAVLSPGVRIADHIRIGKGAKVMGNIFINSAARHLFGDEGIAGKYGSEMTAVCFKLGQA